MNRLLLVAIFSSLLAMSAFLAVKVPFLAFGTPRHLPGAEALYHWKGLVFGSHVISGQLLALWVAAGLLGPRRGAFAIALYLAVGLAGLPVFTNGGGPAYLAEPTFGYLLGFLPAAVVIGRGAESRSFGRTWRALLTGLLLVQGLGLLYEVTLRGAWGVPADFLTLLRDQVLNFLPGQITLLTVVAAAVALWRKAWGALSPGAAPRPAPLADPA